VQLDDLLPILIVVGSVIISIYRALSERGKKPPTQQRPQTGLPKQNVPTTQSSQPTSGDLQKRLEEARRRVQQAMESQTGRSAEGEVGRPPSAPPPLISGGLEGQVGERGTLTGQTRGRGTLEGGGTLESSGGLLSQPTQPKQPQYTRSETQKDVFRPIDTANRNPSDFQQQLSTVQPFMSEVSHRGRTQLEEAIIQPRKRPRTPTNAPKHAKINGSELLAPEMLTEKELLRGFLWQQILSEPRSKVKLRTYSLQRAKAEDKG
jgi:hypothetical protein